MLDILAYTAYIHTYILRISCVYLVHVTNIYIYACYTTYWICSIYCVYTCVYTAYILRVSGVCLLTYVSRDLYIGVVLHILDMLDILHIYMRIYCVHHRISSVCYEHGVYALFDILDIFRIYCIYTAYITHMSNIGILHIFDVCYATYIYINNIGVLQHAWYTCIYCVYTCVYTAYILRISGACFRTWCVCVYMCIIGVLRTLDILAYTTYIYAYILRIYYVYLTYAANMCICMLYDILDMLDILRIYCIYTTYILRVSGVCLLTYRSRDLYIYIYIGVVLHILDMLDILRIYMRIYYAHHRISGVCSEHMYMHIYQLCIYTIIIGVLQHAGYTCIYYIYTCVYIAYILRISGACFRTYVYGVCVCMCIIGFYNMLDILAYTAYIHAYILRTYCVYLVHVSEHGVYVYIYQQ